MSSAVSGEVKDLLTNVEVSYNKGATVNERKAIRAEKVGEFKEEAERILGPSFDADKWKNNNKDDEKKEVTKIFERRVSGALNLPYIPDE